MTLEKGPSGETARESVQSPVDADALAFLAGAGVTPSALANARAQAAQQQVPVSHVLFSSGLISKENYIRHLAHHHGLACACDNSDLAGYEIDHFLNRKHMNQKIVGDKSGLINLKRNGEIYVALDALRYDEATIQMFLQSGQVSPRRLLLVTPDLMDALVQPERDASRLNNAVYGLAQKHKGLSARDKTTYGQKIVLSFLFGFLAWGLVLAPISTLYVLGGVLNLLFLYSNLLRLAAVRGLEPVGGGTRRSCDRNHQ